MTAPSSKLFPYISAFFALLVGSQINQTWYSDVLEYSSNSDKTHTFRYYDIGKQNSVCVLLT